MISSPPTLQAKKTPAHLDMSETSLHIPILALMHSMLHNDSPPLAYTTKLETSSSNPTLASYLCSTEPSIGVWKDGKMT
jgi:hypothetical protein